MRFCSSGQRPQALRRHLSRAAEHHGMGFHSWHQPRSDHLLIAFSSKSCTAISLCSCLQAEAVCRSTQHRCNGRTGEMAPHLMQHLGVEALGSALRGARHCLEAKRMFLCDRRTTRHTAKANQLRPIKRGSWRCRWSSCRPSCAPHRRRCAAECSLKAGARLRTTRWPCGSSCGRSPARRLASGSPCSAD